MSTTPEPYIDIFLNFGEYYFGDHETRIRTLLGSCVAVTMWHAKKRLGGMCHFLVPERAGTHIDELDGRYGTEALLLMIRDAMLHTTNPADYEFKIFGGGNMFPSLDKKSNQDVGSKNIRFAEKFLQTFSHNIHTQHVGGFGHRNIIFEISTGDVWVQHLDITERTAANG